MKEVAYKEVKIISSENTDMMYAPDIIKFRAKEAEKEGWKKFGPITTIYDEEADCYLTLQVMTKPEKIRKGK